MTTYDCSQVMEAYATFLSSNVDISGARPHPLFFQKTACGGAEWPERAYDPPNDYLMNNPVANGEFGGFYIPAGWKVTFTLRNGETFVMPADDSTLPVLVTDASLLRTPQSTPLLNNVESIRISYPTTPVSLQPYTVDNWKYQMCNNQIYTTVGSLAVTSWRMGSPECDTFMQAFCERGGVANVGCSPDTPGYIAQLPPEYSACSCLAESHCLQDTFCQSTTLSDQQCGSAHTLQAVLPVTCFGKYCSAGGYRFGSMLNQKCNVTFCQQVVSLVGNEIYVQGGSTIWCGNRSYTPTPSTTPTPTTTPTPSGATAVPNYVIIISVVLGMFLCVGLPLAILSYRRYYKNQKATLPASSPAPITASTSSEFAQ